MHTGNFEEWRADGKQGHAVAKTSTSQEPHHWLQGKRTRKCQLFFAWWPRGSESSHKTTAPMLKVMVICKPGRASPAAGGLPPPSPPPCLCRPSLLPSHRCCLPRYLAAKARADVRFSVERFSVGGGNTREWPRSCTLIGHVWWRCTGCCAASCMVYLGEHAVRQVGEVLHHTTLWLPQ